MKRLNKRGQAVVELAVFGSMVIFMFSFMLSYIQRYNDQQYVQMEAFRRAQYLACTSDGSSGAGASAQMTLLHTRRNAEVSGDYGKGSVQSIGGSASVYWAIPGDSSSKNDTEDEKQEKNEALSQVAYRINDDQKVISYRKYVPYDEREDWYFTFEDVTSDTSTRYTGTTEKQEDKQGIINIKKADLRDTLHTNITYTVRKQDSGGGDTSKDTVLDSGEFWDVAQGVYRDPQDGGYKYSSDAVGKEVHKERTWKTEF